MKKEELFERTRDELRVLAKTYEVVGRGKMTKEQLIEALAKVIPDDGQQKAQAKSEYIKTVEKGTIMAFRLPNGKVKSAKMIERSLKREKLKMETSYGKQFVISFEDVIWVKTGDRWPKGVFNLLKGNVPDERETKVQ